MSTVVVKVRVGRSLLEIQTDKATEVFRLCSEMSVLGMDTCECGEQAFPQHRHHGGYDFYAMKCGTCEKELKLGQRKSDGGLFPKSGEWEEPYRREPEPAGDYGEF